MINFFGLNKILSKEKLWTTEKERLNVIKRVEIARSCNLPMHILNIVFPLGWKSPETNYAKGDFCKRIVNEYPLPLLEVWSLQDMSEQEMRIYIEKLDKALEKQFDGCIALLYNIGQNDEKFTEVKRIFVKKFLKVSKLEIIIGCFCVFSIIIIALGLFVLILKGNSINIFEYLIVPFIAVIVLLLTIYFFFIGRYFKIGEDNYPRLL